MKKLFKIFFALSLLAITANAQETETIQIGEGVYQSERTPICNWEMWAYTGTETLYLKDELGLKPGDEIVSLSFYCCRGSAQGGNFNVRMKNTSISSLKEGEDQYDTSTIEIGFDEPVYGNVTLESYSAGSWITFPLTTPFIYKGENIIVDVRNTSPSASAGGCYFAVDRYFGVDNRRGIAWHRARSENPHLDGFNGGGIFQWAWESYDQSIIFTELPKVIITYIPSKYNYDVNGDGHVTSADITALYNFMLGI